MSNVLSGEFKLRKNNPGIKGMRGEQKEVSVDVPSRINRQTNADLISRYTKNGFDWNKWSLPIVAEMPGGEQYLLDGDHRRHMFKKFYPDATTMPAWIIQVNSLEEFHSLFVEINSTARKNVNGDEAFIHMVHAGDEKALQLKENLIMCGVSVNGSPEEGGIIGAENSKFVKINSFKRAISIADQASVKKAVDIIESSWDNDRYPKWSDKIHGELLQGFSAIYKNYKTLSDESSSIKGDFEKWVNTVLSTNPPDVVASEYKKKGGSRQHKQGYSIALAIITEFRKSNLHNAQSEIGKRQSALPPKNIKRYINC